jgi:exosome complex RNA-binding protein Rrp42 (RNase PH superfamily)
VRVPTGGTNGQALIKSGTSVVWATVSGDVAEPIYDGGII